MRQWKCTGYCLLIPVRLRLGRLREIIRRSLTEAGGGWASPPQPAGRNSFSADINNREQIGRLESGTPVDDDLPPHLRDPQEDEEDCYGPVPPTGEEPYMIQDPYVRGSSPLPTPGVRRG